MQFYAPAKSLLAEAQRIEGKQILWYGVAVTVYRAL